MAEDLLCYSNCCQSGYDTYVRKQARTVRRKLSQIYHKPPANYTADRRGADKTFGPTAQEIVAKKKSIQNTRYKKWTHFC